MKKKSKKPSPKPKKESVKAIVKSGPPTVSEAIESVLIKGDLAPLSPEQRLEYYKAVCKSLGLNMLTNPFRYILFKETDGAPPKLALYAAKDCAEQLRKIHRVGVIPNTTKRMVDEDFATTELSVIDRTGRTDTATGMVYLWHKGYDGKPPYRLSGQKLGDAVMKSETKAKRRATLSICGLGILDEMDLESVKVVGGVTAEGRIFEYPDLPEQGSHEAAVDVGERKIAELREKLSKPEEAAVEVPKANKPDPLPPMPSNGTVEIEWCEKDAIVRGDIANLLPLMQEKCMMSWVNDWWHCTHHDVKTIGEMCAQLGYRMTELLPKSSPAVATPTATAKPGHTAAKGNRGETGRSAPVAAETIRGIIQQANPNAGAKPRLDVLLKDGKVSTWMSAWNRDHWPHLTKGKGQEATLVVERKTKDTKTFTNIVGLVRVGPLEFDTDGKTPIIQNSTREAGGKTLYD